MSKIKQTIGIQSKKLIREFTKSYRHLVNQIDQNPLRSFFIVLFLIFLTIILSNIVSKPRSSPLTKVSSAKTVEVYSIGSVPTVSLEGKVDKSGVVTIVAQTPGIVQNIYITEGSAVSQGNWIAYISTNYQGGNTASLQRQIAQAQYQNIFNIYDTQKELIDKQRDLADKNADNAQELRQIAAQSINNAQALVNLDQDIANSLSANISTLEANNINGSNDAMILSTKQIMAQVQAGLNQIQTALQTTQYQTDTTKTAAGIPDTMRDITQKQLDIQQKALDLSKEIAKLQLQIAQVAEAMLYPSAPFNALVQKVFVRVGQAVNPGEPIAVISSPNIRSAKITVYASREIASRVSTTEESILHIGNTTISAKPLYVSVDAVQGSLYAITYIVSDVTATNLTDKGYIRVDVPVGYAQTTYSDPFVPIDAIYQTTDKAYLYLIKDGKALNREVSIGAVYGRYVEILQGLKNKDLVILDRTVISGDKVEIKHNTK